MLALMRAPPLGSVPPHEAELNLQVVGDRLQAELTLNPVSPPGADLIEPAVGVAYIRKFIDLTTLSVGLRPLGGPQSLSVRRDLLTVPR
jgi:hypothetical protein